MLVADDRIGALFSPWNPIHTKFGLRMSISTKISGRSTKFPTENDPNKQKRGPVRAGITNRPTALQTVKKPDKGVSILFAPGIKNQILNNYNI